MPKNKTALITGVGGQDGFFLARLLQKKGYTIYGISNVPLQNLFPDDIKVWDQIIFTKGDITNVAQMNSLLEKIKPDELYHLAAQSNVGRSFSAVEETMHVNVEGTKTILEAVKDHSNKTKIYFAGSSEMFGEAQSSPQNESTPFNPTSPYGESKVIAHELGKKYNEKYGIFFATGITYNHESERRPPAFVTMKICQGLVNIKDRRQNTLELGNLESIRDWGYAEDYVNAMWLMLQQETPNTYVISSGIGHSVEDFVNICAKELGIQLIWEGTGKERKAYDQLTNKLVIDVNYDYYREAEKTSLIGNSEKIIYELEWTRKYSLEKTIKLIISSTK